MTGGQYDGLEEEFLADLRRLGELHQAHLANGWSLRAAARAIGLSPTTVSEWLKGSRFPKQPDAFTKLIALLRTALAEARIDVQAGDRHLLNPDAWRTRHRAVAQQRAQAVSAGVRRAQATAVLAEVEVRARFAALPDKPRPVAAWTAQQLGVHPAIYSAANGAEGAFVLPDYVERDHDRQLRVRLDAAAANRQAAMIVVRGESCTGKTRTAYEAVRARLGDWQLVFPKEADSLLALLAADALTPRTVLWLNEAQDFLTGPAGEAAAAALQRRLENPGPVVVLTTLWPTYHRALTATPEPGKDSHPHARALLGPVVPIDVPGRFTAEDLKSLRARTHSSLTTADRTSPGGTITQTLAAGPQLVDHYEQAVPPHGPYGKAIITAAMDARRLGHASPLPAALLRAAAPGYLTEEQRAAAPETWFTDALAYARSKVKGVAAALGPVADPNGMGALPDVYRLADYLDHHARATRHSQFPPASFWTAVECHAASAAELIPLADHAKVCGRYRIAERLCQKAVGASSATALQILAELRERTGDTEEAERLYRQAADTGDISALEHLARLRERAGDTEGAERLLREAVDAGRISGLKGLAWLREREGDTEGAEQYALKAAAAGLLDVLRALAERREQAGDSEAAERLYRQAADACDSYALEDLARLREQAGDSEAAERLYRQAADTGSISALRNLAKLREKAEDREGAEQYRQAANSRFTVKSSSTITVKPDEDPEVLERLYRQAAEAGHIYALGQLAFLREKAGDREGAEQYVRQVLADQARTAQARATATTSAQGFQSAPGILRDLARWRAQAGDIEGATRLYREAIDAGDFISLEVLGQVLAEAGDPRLKRFGLKADGSVAEP
ncbi:hypothetical protein ABZ553_25560 [Streptomyces sparsogenes]|uniref:hypothetical protein n=1 Tax=Streptomyces sparsogenes TaxID=67365 RepID=UPI0033F4AC2E